MNNLLLKVLVAFVLIVSMSAQAESSASEKSQAQQLLQTAQAKYEQSRHLGFAWRSTNQAIAAAQTAYDAAEYSKAQQEAQSAIKLAEASIAQANTEATAWRTRQPFHTSEAPE